MNANTSIGDWLRQRRKALDLTQAELADKVGCALVTVRKIESGAKRPSKQMAERLAAVLAIAPEEREQFVAFARGLNATPPAVLAPGAGSGPVHHLPSQPTPFVGRSQELTRIHHLLGDPACRLLTLVGPGGIGKTRLALEAAHTHRDNFAHGAHYVSLALVNSADLLLFAIGNVLEFSFRGPVAPVLQLTNYLRDKPLLLLLDSVEHLLDSVPLLGELLAGAPHLKLLVTSRERLNLRGEWVLPIEGMDYPQALDHHELDSYSAVQLFVQSAQRVQAGFSLSSELPGVLRICQLVEGMPLGLELAAAWIRLLPCARIAEQLASSLDFLASPLRDVPDRHRSLRAVFDHSWGLLPGPEQAAMAKLSVFRGSFDLEAAEEVGGAALPVLASLADKSLLRADGTGRYVLHELLRQYAADQLAQRAVAADHQARAIDYLTQAAERASQAAAQRQAAALVGQAIAIAEEAGQFALLGELHHKRGQALLKATLWVEARPDIEAAWAAARAEAIDQQFQLLLELSDVNYWLRDGASQLRYVNQALALACFGQRDDLAAVATVKLAYVVMNEGNLEEAVSLFERALAQGADGHYGLGRTLYYLGRYADALHHQRLAVELTRSDPRNQILPLQDFALTLVATGQYTEALRVNDEACRLSREHEAWTFLARAVENSAGFHLDVFDYAGSETLAAEARELARSVDFVQAVVSAEIDLMLNFARRGEVGRATNLVDTVASALDEALGAHFWVWRLRLAQARAEIALARGDWEDTLRLIEIALQHSLNGGRVKYQVLGLKTRAQALAALGRTHEAVVDLRNALALTRPTGDPAMFVQVAAALLTLEGNDVLAHEAYATAQRISAALPNDEMRRIFEGAEPVQKLARLVP